MLVAVWFAALVLVRVRLVLSLWSVGVGVVDLISCEVKSGEDCGGGRRRMLGHSRSCYVVANGGKWFGSAVKFVVGWGEKVAVLKGNRVGGCECTGEGELFGLREVAGSSAGKTDANGSAALRKMWWGRCGLFCRR